MDKYNPLYKIKSLSQITVNRKNTRGRKSSRDTFYNQLLDAEGIIIDNRERADLKQLQWYGKISDP